MANPRSYNDIVAVATQRIQEYEHFLEQAKQAVQTLQQFEKLSLPSHTNGNGNVKSRRPRGQFRELLLKQMQDAPKTVQQLVKALHCGPPTIYKHLTKLRKNKQIENHGGLWGLRIATKHSITPKLKKRSNKEVRKEANQKILDMLHANGPMTAKNLNEKLKLYNRAETIYGPLNQLLKAGKITHKDNMWSA